MTAVIKKLTLIALLAALVACGGGDDPVTTTEEDNSAEDIAEEVVDVNVEDIQVDTASDVVTTLADVNGFRVVSELYNVHADGIYGTEVKIYAYVKDHSNNPVEDGTIVTFVADDHGYVGNQCATKSGACFVTWVSALDRSEPGNNNTTNPYADSIITIMARTIGEDSFIDKNANSLFDVGETTFTQSEPYLDANDNYGYDAGMNDFDEFFDYNNNGVFDLDTVFSLFRGQSCTTGAIALGHCAGRVEVWDTVRLSSSNGGPVTINLYSGSCGSALTFVPEETTINVTTEDDYCLVLQDVNGNVPPPGTAIELKNANGLIFSELDVVVGNVNNAVALLGTGFSTTVTIKPDAASDTGDLEIIVTPINDGGRTSSATYTIQD